MRYGTALLTQTLKAAACICCLFALCPGFVLAQELEPTDSGAPSAIVMFPVTGKAEIGAGAMKPVVFNHLVHEKAVSDCESCHHTGDPQACSDCHTLQGSPEGNNITLERAMHARDIAPRAKGKVTPKSCVSCHEEHIAQTTNCMGCHSIVTPARDANWCNVCHNAEVTPEQMSKGMADTMDSDENLAIATAAVFKRAEQPQVPGYFAPTKVRIGSLSKEFEPCLFNHRGHVASLVGRIKDDSLARAFHYQPEVICATCHHNSPLSMTPPKCSSCHEAKINPDQPERPNLKAAYHLQCMGCHTGMNVHRPLNTSCTTCHKAAAEK